MSLGLGRTARIRRSSGVAIVALAGVVLPFAVACDTGGDSSAGTTTVERTVVAPPEPTTDSTQEPETSPPPEVTTTVPSTEAEAERTGPGVLWFAQAADGALRPIASVATEPAAVIAAVAAGPDDPELVGGLPPGTVVQSIQLDGATAVVDLSVDFEIGYQTGSAAETVAVAPLVYSATELPSVDAVLITVDGQPPMPVGASFDFTAPLTRADVPAVFAEGFG